MPTCCCQVDACMYLDVFDHNCFSFNILICCREVCVSIMQHPVAMKWVTLVCTLDTPAWCSKSARVSTFLSGVRMLPCLRSCLACQLICACLAWCFRGLLACLLGLACFLGLVACFLACLLACSLACWLLACVHIANVTCVA